MISYSNQTFSQEDDIELTASGDQDSADRRKDYRRGRSYRTQRRRARRRASTPSCGISGRRNKRFGW